MWVITVLSVMAVTFITFITTRSSPLNWFAVVVTGIMWVACIGLTYCVVKIHREYWK